MVSCLGGYCHYGTDHLRIFISLVRALALRELHIEPVVLMARLFKEGHSYRTGGEYDAVLTIQRMRHIAYLTGCNGSIDTSAYRELMRQLKAMGISEVHWLRDEGETVKEMI